MAGLFTSLFAFGNFLGPTVSGVLYDAIGFQYNMIVLQADIMKISQQDQPKHDQGEVRNNVSKCLIELLKIKKKYLYK